MKVSYGKFKNLPKLTFKKKTKWIMSSLIIKLVWLPHALWRKFKFLSLSVRPEWPGSCPPFNITPLTCGLCWPALSTLSLPSSPLHTCSSLRLEQSSSWFSAWPARPQPFGPGNTPPPQRPFHLPHTVSAQHLVFPVIAPGAAGKCLFAHGLHRTESAANSGSTAGFSTVLRF